MTDQQRSSAEQPLPASARVVVVGGGIIGNSIAYHLAHIGCDDVVLLEREDLTCGTTWHAAGLMVTYGSLSETATEMRKYSRALYARLEAETGQATGLNQCGFIELATSVERLEEYRRVSAFNRYCGVDVQEISAREVQDLFPIARVDDVLAGFYVEDDGRVNPVDVTMALARGARMKGARLITGVSATGVTRKNGAVTGVTTEHGVIACDILQRPQRNRQADDDNDCQSILPAGLTKDEADKQQAGTDDGDQERTIPPRHDDVRSASQSTVHRHIALLSEFSCPAA